MKAFVFSSSGDREAAAFCCNHLRNLGIACVVVLEDKPPDLAAGELVSTFPRNGRLFGAACSAGMASFMASEAGEHEVVAKVDADMRLSPEGVAWLAGAKEKARGYSIGRKIRWCGCWAAPAFVFQEIADRLSKVDCEGCPESNLFHCAFKATCGIERMADAVQVWRAGRAINFCSHVVTLPSGVPPEVRAAELRTLFGVTV